MSVRRGRIALAAIGLLPLALANAGAAAAAPSGLPVATAPVVVAGPSAAIGALSGLSIAHDGSGGLIYTQQVAGVQHVFVSRLVGGTFQAPDQVDASLAGPSSQPVLAAGNGGVLLVAFVNGGQLYVVGRTGASSNYSAPAVLATAAGNPAIAMSNFGKGYLAFTVAGPGGGDDVRAAFYWSGHWTLESSPLNAVPDDDAGSGSGHPAVAAAGDGVAIVVWGEGGHIYSRRVWGTSPSVVFEQADAPLPGCSEISADQPAVGSGGDSSFAAVAFREALSCSSTQHQRVLMNRLHGSVYDGVRAADALGPGASTEGADEPRVAVGEYGTGFVTAVRDTSNQLFAMALGTNDAPGQVVRLDSLGNTAPPNALPALAGTRADLVAWQQDPGVGGAPDIRVRYAPDGATLGPETVLSSPGSPPPRSAAGLLAGGDQSGDAAVAWLQGAGSATEIVAARLYQPPGAVGGVQRLTYVRSTTPVLHWSPALERWGPLRYDVTIDGTAVAQTTATSLKSPLALSQGSHSWQVTATNPAGQARASRLASVWVDTIAPAARLSLTGHRQARSRLRLHVSYTDSPPPVPRGAASGITTVTVLWGDGTVTRLAAGAHRTSHAFAAAGRYKLSVVLVDRAGNVTRLVRHLRITTPRRHRRPKHG